ncbi:ABC transporter ATP-binding protein [Altererythrobacter sp. MTPC7]|uniref:ABC transporter ATP-binding protein n=1 Tax=Altererythrobacter sp. MTPC7 TaxID=3056567 RepID=UPI0036F1FA5C
MTGNLSIMTGRTALGRLIRARAGAWPLVLLLGLAVSLLEGVGIGLIIPVAALLLAPGEARTLPEPFGSLVALTGLSPGDAGTSSAVAVLGAAILLAVVLKTVLQAANALLIARIDVGIARSLIDRLAACILALDYDRYLETERARLLQALSTESWEVAEAVRAGLSLLPALAGLAIFGLILLWLDPVLLGLVGILALGLWAILGRVEKRQQALGAVATAENRALGWRMLWIVEGLRTIRLFGESRAEQARFESASGRTAASVLAVGRLAAVTGPLAELLLAVLFLAVLFAGVALDRPAATMAAFLLILLRTYPYASRLSQARIEVAARRGAVDEVEWLLGQETGQPASTGAAEGALDQTIAFQSVSYAYPGREGALHDVDCRIPAGEITALIGPTGSGKSTLVTLLSRLVTPDSGILLAGGRDVRDIPPDYWRARMAYAGQDIALVEGTVRENIAFGSGSASNEAVRGAAHAAGAAGMIDSLPDGYDTPLGPGGMALSGGQRQRIALARALLRRPDILVLDEATSAIDAPSESEIVALLERREHFRTAIVISHRRSTLAACSHGIVLRGGRVVEEGPVETLAWFRMLGETGE